MLRLLNVVNCVSNSPEMGSLHNTWNWIVFERIVFVYLLTAVLLEVALYDLVHHV